MPSHEEPDSLTTLLCDAYAAPPLDEEFSAQLVRRLQAQAAQPRAATARPSPARRLLLWLVPRRRLQFGLRAVLLLMLAVCIGVYVFVRPYQVQRAAARHIKQLGGRVETAPGGPAWFRNWFGEGHLQDVVMIDVADCDDPAEYLPDVLCCPKLEVLVVGGDKFTDRQLRQLAGLKKLRGLVLDTTRHTKAGLAELQASLPKLEPRYSWRRAEEALRNVASFDVGTYRSWEVGAAFVVDYSFYVPPEPYGGPDWLRARTQDRYFKDLIFVTFNEQATDEHLQWLPRLGGYQGVTLKGSPVTDRGLAQLVEWGTQQVTLDYAGHPCRFTPEGLAQLAERKRTYWVIRGVPLGDVDLSFLESQTTLEELSLDGTGVSDDQLRHLAALPLTYLYLDNNPLGDGCLEDLPETLRVLSLINTRVSDEGLAALERLQKLRHLRIRGTRLTAAGIERLRKALPNCSIDDESR